MFNINLSKKRSEVLPLLLEESVLQRGACTDALIWVVGQHLVEQRQSRGGTLGQQMGNSTALPRGEVKAHRPGPAKRWRQGALLLEQCTSLRWTTVHHQSHTVETHTIETHVYSTVICTVNS